MKKILVAVDGSDNGRRAQETAIELARAGGAELMLIYVNDRHALSPAEKHLVETEYEESLRHYTGIVESQEPAPIVGLSALDMLQRHEEHSGAIRQILGEGILKGAKQQAERAGVKNVAMVFKDGDPASEIIKAAGETGADLVVVGNRGLGGITSLLQGSVSQKISNVCPVSVLIVKQGGTKIGSWIEPVAGSQVLTKVSETGKSTPTPGKHTVWHIGWRERVVLPELGIPAFKTKFDTGERSEARYAEDIHSHAGAQV